MASQYDDDEDFDLDDYTGDDLVKRLRNQLKASQKQLREQAAQLEQWSEVSHQQTVAQMLNSYGLNPNIARYVPDDVQDENDLAEWLDEYGEDFGIVPDDGESYDDDPDVQAYERMSEIEDNGNYDPEIGYDMDSKIKSFDNPNDLLAYLHATGQ